MNLKEIKDLIELVNDKGFAEFEIERQGFRLRISRFNEPQPQLLQTTPTPTIISSGVAGASEGLSPGAQRGLIEAQVSSAGSNAASAQKDVQAGAPEPEMHVIKSPIVGTFFSAPAPGAKPYVTAGDRVDKDTVVCIIEAMKLMNEIQAEISGVISHVYVENGQPVEYGQNLFGIKT
jgi:acetyl-CoA carboxylase biotin carboxyl carrier protein